MKPNVFEFSDPVDFLNASLQAAQEINPKFSLRSWAHQLGLSHVALLSMVLNRKRTLRPSLGSKVSSDYRQKGKFTEDEARYFDMLVLFRLAKTSDEKKFYQQVLASLRPDQEFSTLQLDQLRLISDWYHVAILEMTFLKNFKSDSKWIQKRLGDTVTEGQIKEAINRLIRLGLLQQTPEGLKKTTVHLATPTDQFSRELQSFHAQLIQKAIVSLQTQSIEERDVTGYTMVTTSEKIKEAKKMIRDFRRQLGQFLETPNGESLYQLNIQLFSLEEKQGDKK